jgi:hypothetical protein
MASIPAADEAPRGGLTAPMARIPPPGPARRDRALRRVRVVSWAAGLAAAGLTGAFSAVAAHAFKGHSGGKAREAAAVTRMHRPRARVAVPPPQNVPAIAGDQASLQPPGAPPQAAPPQQAPAPQEQAPPPVSSGGS